MTTAVATAAAAVLSPAEDDTIRSRITDVLEHFPILSPTMLQVGIGPHYKASRWKPVLEAMVREGEVISSSHTRETSEGRWTTIRKVALARVWYTLTPTLRGEAEEV